MIARYSRRAQAELEAISAYLRIHSTVAANKAATAIEAGVFLLEQNPQAGRESPVAGIREFSIPRTRYKIYYRVRTSDIWIVHIRHTSRRPWQGD